MGVNSKRNRMYVRMVWSSLVRRRSRLLVAILAIAIGATTLSGLVTITYDIPEQMSKEFRSYGANLLATPAGDSQTISEASAVAIQKYLPEEKLIEAAPYRYETLKLHEQPILVAGSDLTAVQGISPSWHVDGAWPQASGEIVLGQDTASLVNLEIGDTAKLIRKNTEGKDVGIPYTISGILRTGGPEDQIAFMSLADFGKLTESETSYDLIEFSLNASGEDLETLSQQINQQIPEVYLSPVTRVTSSETKVLDTLKSLLLLVTVIILTLMMVGVTTTMMAVVTERRSEIALEKALGADDGDIVKEFIGEAILLGTLGGLLGVSLGFGFAQLISTNVFYRSISIRWSLIPATILMSVIVAVVASYFPVRRAAEIDPAIVLQGE